VDIRHTGADSALALSGSGVNDFVDVRADIIKVGALSSGGRLIVGAGSLSADSVLRLYAPSSNGELQFISNVTLRSGVETTLAAGTITIDPGIAVDIQGASGAADVFTNNANYSSHGGTNPANGIFTGNGANAPLPLDHPAQPGF
jgi:hypothetical protein